MDIQVGNIVKLKKKHPCGSFEWEVLRIGADFKLKCVGCGHLIKKMDWIFHSVACRSSIKAGNFTSRLEMERFAKQLLSMPDIRYCPHGRPVLIEMTKRELEKNFGRV